MKIRIHRAGERGTAGNGWLKASYSFSFADYFDPLRERFGVLRVLNDDVIAGGGGFGFHPHNNMEIITIPLSGALEHKDSMGHSMVIRENDVQYMSAGIGVQHAEMNYSATEPVNLLQVWIFPKVRNVEPRYDQITLNADKQKNKLRTIVSPDGGSEIIRINQDAWLSMLDSETGRTYTYSTHLPDNVVFIFLIDGETEVEGNRLLSRDSAEITGSEQVCLTMLKESKLLIIEVPED